MNIELKIYPVKHKHKLEYSFILNDHSIDIVSERTLEHYTSLLFNDLNLELSYDGQLLFFWGYCPEILWEETKLNLPFRKSCQVYIKNIELNAGMSIGINPERWPVYFDKQSMMLCIGNKNTNELIEFNPNSFMSVNNDTIDSVWLKLEKIE